jgi:hypothetical protein
MDQKIMWKKNGEKKLRKSKTYRHMKWWEREEEKKLQEEIQIKLNEIRELEAEL